MTGEELISYLKTLKLQAETTVGNRVKGATYTYLADVNPTSFCHIMEEAIKYIGGKESE